MKIPAYDYALTILSYNPKTISMMRTTLLTKWYELKETDKAIGKLTEQWYLDDYQFCKAYFVSEVINKGKSVNAIKTKMYEKGMPPDITKAVLIELDEEIIESSSENLAKEIQKMHSMWDDLVKIYEKLTRKGHRYDDIKKALEYIKAKKEASTR